MPRILSLLIFCLLTCSSYAWNMQGHRLVAQIAYDNLTPSAKDMCRKYLQVRRNKSLETSFVTAATWADFIRFRNINWYNALHYIDTPFSSDGTVLPTVDRTNAVWGINHSISVLSSNKSNAHDKKLALRLLTHIVGDIHQPLHAATRVSSQLPNGDLGGNLFPLGDNGIATNLHKYWDDGAGLFSGKSRAYQIKNQARSLEKKWSCTSVDTQTNPEQWSQASHSLAVNEAYKINPKESPTQQYQLNAQNITQKQIVIAGCRLATVLNQIAKN